MLKSGQLCLAITSQGRELTTISVNDPWASRYGGFRMHSNVNDTDHFSFESAEYKNCFLGVSQDGGITAPNKVGAGSVSSQFRLEAISLRESN
jgi:hypothetical protein